MYAVARIFHRTPTCRRKDNLNSVPGLVVHQPKKKMNYKPNDRGAKQRASNAPSAKFRPNSNTNQRADGAGHWQRRYEHYRNLAQQAGDADSVTREHYWQHAEHFYRLMNGSASEAPNPAARSPAL